MRETPRSRWAPPLTLPAFLSLCRARRTPAPPGVLPQTGRGAHGRGAAPVASPGAAVLLSVCPCLEAPPRTAPVSLRPARDLWPGLERQRGALPARPPGPPPGGQHCAEPGQTPAAQTHGHTRGQALGSRREAAEEGGPCGSRHSRPLRRHEGRKTEIKDLITQNGLD